MENLEEFSRRQQNSQYLKVRAQRAPPRLPKPKALRIDWTRTLRPCYLRYQTPRLCLFHRYPFSRLIALERAFPLSWQFVWAPRCLGKHPPMLCLWRGAISPASSRAHSLDKRLCMYFCYYCWTFCAAWFGLQSRSFRLNLIVFWSRANILRETVMQPGARLCFYAPVISQISILLMMKATRSLPSVWRSIRFFHHRRRHHSRRSSWYHH